MNSPMRLHIANIDLCDITTESIVNIINALMEDLDDVSKYKVASDLTVELDNLSQTCYDEASADAQLIIETLEDNNWKYDKLPAYVEYNEFMDKFLGTGKYDLDTETSLRILAEDPLGYPEELHDVVDEFNLSTKCSGQLKGQLHFPNDYTDERALARGNTRTTSTTTQADEKKKARAAYLANVKAQQNTSQSK